MDSKNEEKKQLSALSMEQQRKDGINKDKKRVLENLQKVLALALIFLRSENRMNKIKFYYKIWNQQSLLKEDELEKSINPKASFLATLRAMNRLKFRSKEN